jgi:hypothetical protein
MPTPLNLNSTAWQLWIHDAQVVRTGGAMPMLVLQAREHLATVVFAWVMPCARCFLRYQRVDGWRGGRIWRRMWVRRVRVRVR